MTDSPMNRAGLLKAFCDIAREAGFAGAREKPANRDKTVATLASLRPCL